MIDESARASVRAKAENGMVLGESEVNLECRGPGEWFPTRPVSVAIVASGVAWVCTITVFGLEFSFQDWWPLSVRRGDTLWLSVAGPLITVTPPRGATH